MFACFLNEAEGRKRRFSRRRTSMPAAASRGGLPLAMIGSTLGDPTIPFLGGVRRELGRVRGALAPGAERRGLREEQRHLGPFERSAGHEDIGSDQIEGLPRGPQTEADTLLLRLGGEER